MDRLRPAMLIAALVVDVGRRLPRRGASAMPPSDPSARLIRVYGRRCSGEGRGGLDRLERGWVDAHADLGSYNTYNFHGSSTPLHVRSPRGSLTSPVGAKYAFRLSSCVTTIMRP